jgi:phosphatidylserine decarboxylase
MKMELAWGRVRRQLLKLLRPGYVARMRAARRGTPAGYPHEIIDSRDLKYYRNRHGFYWPAADDPFARRDRLPVARVGLAEVLIFGGSLLALAAVLLAAFWPFWPLAAAPAALAVGVVWFFRDPARTSPTEAGLVVSPADGRVVSAQESEHDEFLGGPAVTIGIFLSVLDVHMNRSPTDARVIGLTYRRGRFLNALRPESARENESLEIRLEERSPPHRGMRVRQIAGAIARRVVCWAAPGDYLARGDRFGMIKFGSRTELSLPRAPGLELLVRPGQKVYAGVTAVAKYSADPNRGAGVEK